MSHAKQPPHPLSLLKTELVWQGKYDAQGKRRKVDPAAWAVPLQCSEMFGDVAHCPSDTPHRHNMLIEGDNLRAIATLVDRFQNQVDLIYIDPPFAVGTDFTIDVPLASSPDFAGHAQQTTELVAYRDTWKQGPDEYLAMMYDRLVLLRCLLSERGTIYVHCDTRVNFLLRAMMDEIFGREHFRNEIAWCYRGGGVPRNDFAAKHDTILRYTKSDNYIFNVDQVRVPYSEDVRESSASRYDKSYRDNKVYAGYRPHESGKHPDDWWPIQPLMPSDKTERLDYPTQKPIELLQRIVDASSEPESLVLDAFAGSGTTLAVAAGCRVRRQPGAKGKLEYFFAAPRRWIGIDEGRMAIHTIRKRMIDLERSRQEAGLTRRAFDVFTVRPSNQPVASATSVLEAEAVYHPTPCGMTVDIRIVRFIPALAEMATKKRRARPGRVMTDGWDYIDFWAVDFEYASDREPILSRPFCSHWQDYRTRNKHGLSMESESKHQYAQPGCYQACVKVIDIFGRETSILVAIQVDWYPDKK